jgi:hypothetical protein
MKFQSTRSRSCCGGDHAVEAERAVYRGVLAFPAALARRHIEEVGEEAAVVADGVEQGVEAAPGDVPRVRAGEISALGGDNPVGEGEAAGGDRGDTRLFGRVNGQPVAGAGGVEVGVMMEEIE